MFRSKASRLALAWGLLAAIASGCPARGTNEARRFTSPRPVPIPQIDEQGRTIVDFATVKAVVLDLQCLECHGDMETAEGLAPYVKAGDPGGSSLFTTMSDGSMPPGGPQASDQALELVREYILQLSETR